MTPPSGYDRLGGAGITKPLWECLRCGASVSDREKHDEWHKTLRRLAHA